MPRTEQYRLGINSWAYNRKVAAVLATPRQVAGLGLYYSARIPPQYFVGTAQHESGFAINEMDTEESGYVSFGIFQVGNDELAGLAGPRTGALESCESLEKAVCDFTRLQEHRLDEILKASPLPISADVWAYLAVAHNQGLPAALKTIHEHGLDWAAYKDRNRAKLPGICKYGDDVISGGESWRCPC